MKKIFNPYHVINKQIMYCHQQPTVAKPTNGVKVEPPKRPLGPLPRPPPAPPINNNGATNGTDQKAATKIEGSNAALHSLTKVSLPDISVLQVEKKDNNSPPVTKIIIYKSKDGTKKPTAKLIIEKVWLLCSFI